MSASKAAQKSRRRKISQKTQVSRVDFGETDCLGTDPIMLVDLEPEDVIYVFTRQNGTQIKYNVATLIDYMLATGSFYEPGTRILFSEEELKSIDECAARGGLKKASVLKAHLDGAGKYAEDRFIRDAIEGLERCGGEVVCELLEIIEGSHLASSALSATPPNADAENGSPATSLPMRILGQMIDIRGSSGGGSANAGAKEIAQLKILTDIFPRVKHYLSQIADQDREKAKQALAHWKLFLKGPPNNPTKDHLGLLSYCLLLLDGAL